MNNKNRLQATHVAIIKNMKQDVSTRRSLSTAGYKVTYSDACVPIACCSGQVDDGLQSTVNPCATAWTAITYETESHAVDVSISHQGLLLWLLMMKIKV